MGHARGVPPARARPGAAKRLSTLSRIEEPQRIDLSLEPLDDYVVIQPSDEEAETKTGLIIPASAESVCLPES